MRISISIISKNTDNSRSNVKSSNTCKSHKTLNPKRHPKALLDFDLKKHRMSMNVNIVIDDPEELERVRQKEMDITKVPSIRLDFRG